MGIGDIISKIFNADTKPKDSRRNEVYRKNNAEHIDFPHTEDINYLKTEKITSRAEKPQPNDHEGVNYKKS